MTCIVAVKDKSKIVLGGDSAGSAGHSVANRKDSKIYRLKQPPTVETPSPGPVLIGFTSSFRMGQLLGHALEIPSRPKGTTLEQYMVTTFINVVRDCLKDGGFAKKKEEKEHGGTFLVVIEDRIFEIQDDYQVGERFEDYNAVGCGEDLALGSLYTTEDWKDAKARAKKALEAASMFSGAVRPPFVFEEVNRS